MTKQECDEHKKITVKQMVIVHEVLVLMLWH